ncbi:hypothetical protein NL676_001305 [Syzygium grande]|nr:hypothetical protein NL676_001305 [Syzygium grande]
MVAKLPTIVSGAARIIELECQLNSCDTIDTELKAPHSRTPPMKKKICARARAERIAHLLGGMARTLTGKHIAGVIVFEFPDKMVFLPRPHARRGIFYPPARFPEYFVLSLDCFTSHSSALRMKGSGGFGSYCGWNSMLKCLWYGVLIATWPLYLEQQFNGFEMVRDVGLNVDIRMY